MGEVVYLIEAKNTGRIKIGKTQDTNTRFQALLTASPFPLRLLRTIPSADATGLEYYLHSRYASYRKHGEWFELPLQVLAALIDEEFTAWPHTEIYALGWREGYRDGHGEAVDSFINDLQKMHTPIFWYKDSEGNTKPKNPHQCPLSLHEQCCVSNDHRLCRGYGNSVGPFIDCRLAVLRTDKDFL